MPPSADDLSSVVARLKRLVRELDVRLATDQIDETQFLFEGGLGLDSFAIGELIVSVEQEFDFEFPEADLTPESFRDLQTLGGVIAGNLERPE